MSISREEMFNRNLELTKKRLLRELETPLDFEWIPQDAQIINLPREDPQLLRANLQLAMKLAEEPEGPPVVLVPEAGYEVPWQELLPAISGKRVVDIESTQGGAGLDLVFDDGSRLMLFAAKRIDEETGTQSIIGVGLGKKAMAQGH